MRFPLNIFHALERAWDDARTRPRGAALLLLLCVATFVLYVSLVHHAILALGCFIVLAGLLFPVFLEKWKAGFSFLLVLAGTLLVLQQEAWFRGFFKANFISVFSSQMTRYGTQFEKLTVASQAMYDELETNRLKMAVIQETIDTQQKHIEALNSQSQQLLADVSRRQEAVDSTVTNFAAVIAKQQFDIKNVSDLLRNLLVRKTEQFTFGDTNRLLLIEKEDGAVYVIVRLEAEPIPGFIDITYRNMIEGVSMLKQLKGNIYGMVLEKEAYEQSVRPYGLIVKYVADPVKTNTQTWLFTATNRITIDGAPCPFPGQKRYLFPETTNISSSSQ